MQASSDRLPWLSDEPPGGSAKVVQKKAGGAMWPWYLLLLLLVGAVVAGAWWLSTGKEAAPPTLPAETSLPIPVTREETAAGEALPEAPAVDPTSLPAAAPRQSQTGPSTTAVPRSSSEPLRRQAPVTSQADEAAERGVFPADEPAAAPPAAGPGPIILYHPQPNRGRVVQLGAFPTRAQAETTWRRITRRYPYLSSKPKMVNTVDVRAMGGGRPTRMYRLQLGTSSQAQSVVICQQLERAGHSCVVVY